MKKILVLGQTPPPYHGQSILTQKLLEYDFSKVEIHHVRMAFSSVLEEVGQLKMGKMWHLLEVIVKIAFSRLTKGVSVLYYPPAGPNKIPIIRDIVILIATRWMFKKTIFHFHAGGVSEHYHQLSPLMQFFFRWAYYGADAALVLSRFNPADGDNMKCKKQHIVPNGISDASGSFSGQIKPHNQVPIILFVGAVRETKGVSVLIEAAKLLKDQGEKCEFRVMGKFKSAEFEREARAAVKRHGLEDSLTFLGVRIGGDKDKEYFGADIFCFPTFFEAETFGLVLCEAMQFELPVVTTRWRGIPDIVSDGESGFLVSPQDPKATAEKLKELLHDPVLRTKMGKRGREIYLEKYTLNRYLGRVEDVLYETAHG